MLRAFQKQEPLPKLADGCLAYDDTNETYDQDTAYQGRKHRRPTRQVRVKQGEIHCLIVRKF
jgi:hypothetical protein